jgi:hypothetical protein
MLVVGESNCAKDDVGVTPDVAVSAVNGNPWFTREVINRACILMRLIIGLLAQLLTF